MAVFLGESWSGGAGYLLTVESKSREVYTDATAVLTDWVAPSVYSISIVADENGTTETSATEAIAGETITITATPNQGYKVDSVKYNDGEEHEVSLSSGKYTFEMPAKNVTVKVTYVAETTNQVPDKPTSPNGGEEMKAPQTADANHLFIWLALATGSCIVHKCVLEYERSKKRIRRR